MEAPITDSSKQCYISQIVQVEKTTGTTLHDVLMNPEKYMDYIL